MRVGSRSIERQEAIGQVEVLQSEASVPADSFIKLNAYNLFWIFVVTSVVGLVVETLVSYPADHMWKDRAGLVFGTLKYFLGSSGAISCVSIIFDYSVAYAFVGFAGLFRRKYMLLPVAALVGGFARFIIHFISGVTVYAQYMPEEFMGISGMTPFVYSLLYNGTYMLPNTVIAVAVCAALIPVIPKLERR